MTDDPEDLETAAEDTRTLIYEVFNPDNTAGVACNRDGEIVGLYLTDEARDNGEASLAYELLRLARLAHAKSRLGLRAEMERSGTRPYTVDSFDLPTAASYRALEAAEFGTGAS